MKNRKRKAGGGRKKEAGSHRECLILAKEIYGSSTKALKYAVANPPIELRKEKIIN